MISLTQKNNHQTNPTNFQSSIKNNQNPPLLPIKIIRNLKISTMTMKKSTKKFKKSRVLPKSNKNKLQRRVTIMKNLKKYKK